MNIDKHFKPNLIQQLHNGRKIFLTFQRLSMELVNIHQEVFRQLSYKIDEKLFEDTAAPGLLRAIHV